MTLQTSGSVLKSLTALSLARTDIVPSSLLYWIEESLRQASSKSSIPVHWENTIAFSPREPTESLELLSMDTAFFSGTSPTDFPLSAEVELQSELSLEVLCTWLLWEVWHCGLDNDCNTSSAAFIFEESHGWVWEQGSESPTSEPGKWSQAGSDIELFSVALGNTADMLSRVLQFVAGHWLSSPVRCSQMHWLQKTWPQTETTASSGASCIEPCDKNVKAEKTMYHNTLRQEIRSIKMMY